MSKLKITIKPPRCRVCRERIRTGETKEIINMIEGLIKDKLGFGIPITIIIEKKSAKKPNLN